jgi:FkbM family methyltransferase
MGPMQHRRSRALVLALSLAATTACPPADPPPAPADPTAVERERDQILRQPKRYSQFDEEILIRHFFNDRRGGFFVDVGAADYDQRSTTYYLEKHLGWSGIAIDALDEFRAGYEKHRPRTKFVSYIVTDHAGTREPFYRIPGMLPNSSAVKEYAEQWADYAKQVGGVGATGEPTVIEVPTITLTKLLDDHGVDRIDLLSMDIEDGEPAALRGFDIDRFRPELICIEAHESVRDEIAAYMAAHGYERIDRYLARDRVNWYFQPAPHREDP